MDEDQKINYYVILEKKWVWVCSLFQLYVGSISIGSKFFGIKVNRPDYFSGRIFLKLSL